MATHINEEQAVRNLQQYLRRLSYKGANGERPPIDGIFDNTTRDALISFQTAEGLEASGIADKQTWDALYKKYTDVIKDDVLNEGLFLFPDEPDGYEITLGDTQALVRIIQSLLTELRISYDIFEDIIENGTFDAATSDAIKKFQEKNLLTPTGSIDRATYNRIVREYTNQSKSQ